MLAVFVSFHFKVSHRLFFTYMWKSENGFYWKRNIHARSLSLSMFVVSLFVLLSSVKVYKIYELQNVFTVNEWQQFEWWLIRKLIWKWAVVTYDPLYALDSIFISLMSAADSLCEKKSENGGNFLTLALRHFISFQKLRMYMLFARKNSNWVSLPFFLSFSLFLSRSLSQPSGCG